MPVLACTDPTKSYILHIDASMSGLEGVWGVSRGSQVSRLHQLETQQIWRAILCPSAASFFSTLDQLSLKDLKNWIGSAIETSKMPVQSKTDPSDVPLLSQDSSKLELKDHMLNRAKQTQSGRETKQLVLPESYRALVLRSPTRTPRNRQNLWSAQGQILLATFDHWGWDSFTR